MERLQIPYLLDELGQPLGSRIERVLRSLIPRFVKQFPAFTDDQEVTEIFEEAGRRIVKREERSGPVEKLHAFAWVTLLNIGRSSMARDPNRLRRDAIGADAGEAILSTVPAKAGTAKQIEDAVLLREVRDSLTEDEWFVCGWKAAGYSASEIAGERGGSPDAANMVFSRAKSKVFRRLSHLPAGSPGQRPGRSSASSTPASSLADSGIPDGEPTPAPRFVGVHRRE